MNDIIEKIVNEELIDFFLKIELNSFFIIFIIKINIKFIREGIVQKLKGIRMIGRVIIIQLRARFFDVEGSNDENRFVIIFIRVYLQN